MDDDMDRHPAKQANRHWADDGLMIHCANAARKNANYNVTLEGEGVTVHFEEGRDGFVQVIIKGRYNGWKFKVYPGRNTETDRFSLNITAEPGKKVKGKELMKERERK